MTISVHRRARPPIPNRVACAVWRSLSQSIPGVRVRRGWRDDSGQVTAFVVVLVTGLLALIGLTLDGGLALAAKVNADDQAQSAARAGAQAIDLATYRASGQVVLVPAEAVADAQNYLAAIGATGTVTISGTTVTVSITAIHHTELLGLVGIHTIVMHGVGSAQPAEGVLAATP